MVMRAVYNWALWLANIARRGEKPWDQTTFAPAMESVSVEVTMRHLNLVRRGAATNNTCSNSRFALGQSAICFYNLAI